MADCLVGPLGPRRVMGAVWGPGMGDFDMAKLRPVARLVDAPPLTPEMIEFLTRNCCGGDTAQCAPAAPCGPEGCA